MISILKSRHTNITTKYFKSFCTVISPIGSIQNETSRVKRTTYLDNQATTLTDPRVLDAMLPYFSNAYGNPHSRSHAYGWEAESAVENARENVAKLIGNNVDKSTIVFTSGATESNNLAIKGIVNYVLEKTADKTKLPHIITTVIEHKCVLSSCRRLETDGLATVDYLPVNEKGLVDLALLKSKIRPGETCLVSIMAVNNEIGVIQDLKKIGEICREKSSRQSPIFFHTDAAQAIGKIEINVDEMNIDLMSISGHKLYGPKGIGALYVRKKNPRVRLRPVIDGGGQERGIRSGTLASTLCVGLGAACEIAHTDWKKDELWSQKLSHRLLTTIHRGLKKVELNGDEMQRVASNLNLSFACVEGESLLMKIADNVSISSRSACTSASLEPSYVLRAIGVNEELAHTSLRFGIGRFTTIDEVDRVATTVVDSVNRLREMSPLWEAEEEGGSTSIQWS